MPGKFTFHHVGVAVPDMERGIEFYTTVLGFRLDSGPFDDPIQKVKVCFLSEGADGTAHLELISPLAGDSPVNGYLKKGIGAYHVCYVVADIDGALAELRTNGCLVISKPVPAVAFGGGKIAWCFTPTNQLLELLEQGGHLKAATFSE
jgi:methylmalonyl-CoA/ethylmalonyl-CoA epimerase